MTSSTPANSDHGRWIRFAPILIIQAYLTFSVVFFATSPWDYPIDEPWTLYGFLALAQAALFLGYTRGVRGTARGYRGRLSLKVLMGVSVVVSGALLYPTAMFRTGGSWDVASAISDPGSAYARSISVRDGGDPVIEYVRFVCGPPLALLYPLTVFYWSRIRPWMRAAAVAVIVGTLLMFLAMGTNKAIADTVILFPWIAGASHLAGVTRHRARKVLTLAGAFVAAFVGFVSFFSRTQETREGSAVRYGSFSAVGTTADKNSWLLRGLPEDAQTAMLGLNTYMTQGYYGLSLCLGEPFEPTWGVGNSMFLTRQTARVVGDSISRKPYPVRIEKYGWDSRVRWASIYPWIASDVSFPGTVLVMYLLGCLFAVAWLDVLCGRNPFAVALFSLLVTALLYIPANNQVLQTGEGVSAFIGVLCAWWATRCRVAAPRGRRMELSQGRLP